MERQKILGFPIHQKSGRNYAVKRIFGKVKWIPLGLDLAGAEKKIEEFCKKNSLDLTKLNGRGSFSCQCSEKITFLEKEIEMLKRRVLELENRSFPPPSPPAPLSSAKDLPKTTTVTSVTLDISPSAKDVAGGPVSAPKKEKKRRQVSGQLTVFNFQIIRKRSTTRSYTYQTWVAVRWIDGKKHMVYLCRDKLQSKEQLAAIAEKKVKAYLKKREIVLAVR